MRYLQLFERFYKPPTEIKDRLDNIVNNLLKQHRGGRAFFDALDQAIKDVTSYDMVLALLKGNTNEWIVSSGEFGDNIYKLWKENKFKCKGVLVFNGKMQTYKIGVTGWYPKDFDLNNKQFIFIDDSLFSGSTFRKVDNFLREYNSKIKSVSVIYDGSREKNKMIKSFFRYYN